MMMNWKRAKRAKAAAKEAFMRCVPSRPSSFAVVGEADDAVVIIPLHEVGGDTLILYGKDIDRLQSALFVARMTAVRMRGAESARRRSLPRGLRRARARAERGGVSMSPAEKADLDTGARTRRR